MKEVIEDGTAYEVSEGYPDPPYVKRIKGAAAEEISIDPLKDISDKLDRIISEQESAKLAASEKP